MTNEEKLYEIFPNTLFCYHKDGDKRTAIICSEEWLDTEYCEPVKALGKELRKVREGIKDEKVLIGYNLAVAICNNYLAESEEVDHGHDN